MTPLETRAASAAKTIGIIASIGEGNVGDEAILSGTIRFLREEFPAYGIRVFSYDPARTAAIHGVDAVPVLPGGWRSRLRSFGAWKKDVEGLALLLIGGGGILYDHGFAPGRARNPLAVWAARGKLLRAAGVPYGLWSVGVGPVGAHASPGLLQDLVYGAAFLSVRDAASRTLLERFAPGRTPTVLPDPAFLLPPYPVDPTNEIVVALRRWFFDEPAHEARFHAILVEALRNVAAKRDLRVSFLPMVAGKEDDVSLAESLAARVGQAAQVLPAYENPADVLPVLCRARAIVAMRLHALILGAVAARPTLALAYSGKVEHVARMLGVDSYDPTVFTAATLERFIERAAPAPVRAAELAVDFRLRAREMLESAAGL